MRRPLVALSLLLVCGTAAATEFDKLAAGDKGVYCHAYVHIDLVMRQQAGLIDEAEVDRESYRAASSVMRKAGQVNHAHYQRRANHAVLEIIEENPGPEVFAARVATCRRYLRL